MAALRMRPSAPDLPPPPKEIERHLARTRRRCARVAHAALAVAVVASFGSWGRFERWGYTRAYDLGTPHEIPFLRSATYRFGLHTMPWFAIELMALVVAAVLVARAARGSRRSVVWALVTVVTAILLPLGVWAWYGAQRWGVVTLQNPSDKVRAMIDCAGYGLKFVVLALLVAVVSLVVLYRQGYWARRRHPLEEPHA